MELSVCLKRVGMKLIVQEMVGIGTPIEVQEMFVLLLSTAATIRLCLCVLVFTVKRKEANKTKPYPVGICMYWEKGC